MQIKDALAADASVVVAGAGDGQVVETVRALRDDGFDGFFSLEPHLAQTSSLGGFSGADLFTAGLAARSPTCSPPRGSSTHDGDGHGVRPAVRLALVGAGVIGKHHGRVVGELGRPDRPGRGRRPRSSSGRSSWRAECGGRAFVSLAEALAAVDIDVVTVCTPTGRHGEVAIEALAAGKHVIIEKPAEVTVARTDEIIAAQRRAGTLVAVISQHRFDPATEVDPRRDPPGRARPVDQRRSPRSTGGGGRATTTPATGAAPGSSTAAAP